MARMRLVNPDSAIIATWTTRKTRGPGDEEVQRARGLPASEKIDEDGNAELKEGESARPVQMTSGNRTKITTR